MLLRDLFGRDYIEEAFRDLGKLSDEELQKGQRLNPEDTDNFNQVDGRVFYQAINKIRENDLARGDNAKGLDTLTVYPVADYQKMKCFLGKNNSSGYCLKGDGELVSVFSSQQSSGSALMRHANENGARHLDAFALRDPATGKISGDLYRLYSRNGFKVDTNLNSGTPGEPYAIVNGVSSYVNDSGQVEENNPQVVIFMKR